MSLTLRPLTFSKERIDDVWRAMQARKGRSTYENHSLLDHHSESGIPSMHEARRLCLGFYQDTEHVEDYIARLDARLSATYLPQAWKAPHVHTDEDVSALHVESMRKLLKIENSKISRRATSLLEQLPATSPSILGALPCRGGPQLATLNPYCMVGKTQNHSQPLWDSLAVVNFTDTIVIRVALQSVQSELLGRPGVALLIPLLNAVIQLLRVSLDLASDLESDPSRWIVVCAFLWTSWQRLLMLELRIRLSAQLKDSSCDIKGFNSIRFVDVVPEIFEYRRQELTRELKATPYLCAWSYRNLINDWGSLTTDLRHFHRIFNAEFGVNTAACNQQAQCSGNSSISCGRFEHTIVVNQSTHADDCEGSCQRLFWDRESFVSIEGGKAVHVNCTDRSHIRYCKADEDTLTISHVWSHGQGGRPDPVGPEGTGFNACLHRRYSQITSVLGCTSYWMDTPCIPSEEILRSECLAKITSIFSNSKVTLICDRDIMTIDISNPTVAIYEKLIAILLVCDWNMRAWTLLESMGGRNSLYLLCRDGRTINVLDVIRGIYLHGSLDIAILCVMRSYLMPPEELTAEPWFDNSDIGYSESEIESAKFLTINHAAVLLGSRHATRDDDDVLIWNLLVGASEITDPIEMWKGRVGERLPTGCLISSALRLTNVPGLSWAPSRPTLPRRAPASDIHERTFPAYDGVDTKLGVITQSGFLAKWQTYKFMVRESTADHSLLPANDLDYRDARDEMLEAIGAKYLSGFKHGLLLQPLHVRGPWHTPVPYQGSSNHVFVICGSHDCSTWVWRGIYEWDRAVKIPRFDFAEVLIA